MSQKFPDEPGEISDTCVALLRAELPPGYSATCNTELGDLIMSTEGPLIRSYLSHIRNVIILLK